MYLLCLGHFDGPLICDLSLILHLALVTDHIYADVLGRMLLHLAEPLRQVGECVLARHVICEEHAVSSSVKDARHRLERLLARRVPNLQLYHLVLDLEPKRAELHSDRNLVLRLELIVHHSLHQTRLPYTCVPDNDELEEVILGGERPVIEHLVMHLRDIFDILCRFHVIISSDPLTLIL